MDSLLSNWFVAVAGAMFLGAGPGEDWHKLPVDKERAGIVEAAQIADPRERLRRLYWFARQHIEVDDPLRELVLNQFLGSEEHERLLGEELKQMAAVLVEWQNLEYWRSVHRGEADISAVPEEVSGGRAGLELENYFEQERRNIEQRSAFTDSYGLPALRGTLADVLVLLEKIGGDVAVRLVAPLLFYESHTRPMGEGGQLSAAGMVVYRLVSMRPRDMPGVDYGKLKRDPSYTYTRELQAWWIRNARDYGAEPPPVEVVEASRRLHDPPHRNLNAASAVLRPDSTVARRDLMDQHPPSLLESRGAMALAIVLPGVLLISIFWLLFRRRQLQS